ncbi:MAG TPA: hypothetical protein PLU71_04885 [Candidatus Dependentiae bacterium]|nr:hypothetical protein [Candidatus Dependentiae bacterium]HRQ63170.1 hypothetical protein [Candidatus Dependentiae bacterium]
MYINKLYLLVLYSLFFANILPGMDKHAELNGTPIRIKKSLAATYALFENVAMLNGPLELSIGMRQARLLFVVCNSAYQSQTKIKEYLFTLPIHDVQDLIITSDYVGNDDLLQLAINIFVQRITQSPQTLWQWRTILHQRLEHFPLPLECAIDRCIRNKIIQQIITLNLATTKKRIITYWFTYPVSCMGISPDNIFVNGSTQGEVCFWDGMYGTHLRSYRQPHTQKIISLHFDQKNKYAASVSADNSIQLWQLYGFCSPHQSPFVGSTCNLNADGTLIAVAHDNLITIYDTTNYSTTDTHVTRYTSTKIPYNIKKLCFNNASTMLASYIKNTDINTYGIHVWDIANNTYITITTKPLMELYFNHDTQITGIHYDGTHTTWSTQTGTRIRNTQEFEYSAKFPIHTETNSTAHLFMQATCAQQNISGKLKKKHPDDFNLYTISANGRSIARSTWGNHIITKLELFNEREINALHSLKTATTTNQLLLITALIQAAKKNRHIDLSKYPVLSKQYRTVPKNVRKLLKKSITIKV